MTFAELVQQAVSARATDLHLVSGRPAFLRVDGALVALDDKPFSPRVVETLLKEAAGEAGWKTFSDTLELDAPYQAGGVRLRLNLHVSHGLPALSARLIPATIPSFTDLGLSETIQSFAGLPDGLVLFTGPTGSGKSTALASILQAISVARPTHIVTLEDPIEYVFGNGKGIVKQREIGMDTRSFAEGLRRCLRQDPDVIMVGEMRDPETIAAALTLAETGHLVFSTLHTSFAAQAVSRIVDSFSGSMQDQVRHQLSLSLRAVVAQRLFPKVGGGLVAAREILLNTPAIGNLIRENKLEQVTSVLQTGRADGMIPMERAVEALLKDGLVSQEDAAPFLPSR